MEDSLKKVLRLILLSSLLVMQSCVLYGKKDPLSLSTIIKQKSELASSLTSVNVSNNVVTIQGSGFSDITSVKMTGTNLDADLKIDSKSNSQIVASATSALSLLVGKTFNLIIGTAEAQATYTVTFALQNGAIQINHLSSLGATSAGQILKFNGTAWAPAFLAASQNYLGTWNATTHLPDITTLGTFNSGDYYVVDSAGTYTSGVLTTSPTTFAVGNWVMFNGSSWDKVLNGNLTGLGTANYIPYYSSSSVLANSPMAVSGSNIGIGTTTPGSSLDVKGTLRLSGATSGFVGIAPAADAGGTTYTLPAADGTNGQVLTTNASGVLSWTSVSVSGGTVTGVTSANADIGVASGTTAPVLTLNSGIGAGQIVKLTAASKLPAVDGSLLTNLTSSNLVGAVQVANGGTGATSLGASQSALGITLAGPLTGNTPALGATVIADRLCASDSSGGTISCINNLPAATVRGSVSGTSGTGNLLFGTSPTITSPVITNIAPAADFTLTQNSVVPFTSVNTGAVANTLYLKAGNVGIGTPTPASNLVIGDGTGSKTFSIDGAAGQVKDINFSSGGLGRWTIRSNSTAESGSNAGSDFLLRARNDAGSTLSDYFFITRATGNIGFSTTSPTNILSFGGNVARTVWMERHTTANTAGNNLSLQAGGAKSAATDKNGGDLILSGGTATGTGTSTISFQTATAQGSTNTTDNAPTTKMTILGSGNVGIGTTSPAYKLDVRTDDATAYASSSASLASPAGGSNILVNNQNNTVGTHSLIRFQALEGNGVNDVWYAGLGGTATSFGGPFVIGNRTAAAAYGEKFRITAAGNVGIGTTAPATRLDIQNTGYHQQRSWNTNSSQQLWMGSVADSVGSYVGNNAYYNSSYQFIPNYTSASGVNFRQDGSSEFWNDTGLTSGTSYVPSKRMVILSSGYVGIGTTGPSTKLHVVGSSGATIATFADGGATTCTVTPATTGFACSSDQRLKKNIESVPDMDSLDKILKLRTVTYNWRNIDNGRHTGYIAQEVEKIAPEFVRTGDDGYKQVSYSGFIPWITGAIKSFYGEFKAVVVRVTRLETDSAEKGHIIASLKTEKADVSQVKKLEVENVEKTRAIASLKKENALMKAYLCGKDPKADFCR